MKKRRTGKIIAIIAIIMMLASQMSVSAFAEADAEDQPHDVTVEQITETEEDAAMETDEAAPNVEIGGVQTKETAENPEVTALKVTEKTAAKAGARAADAEITSEMTQAEIQKIVDEHDTVIIRGGVYQDISVKTNKTTVFKVLDGEAPAEFKCSGKPNEYGPFGFLQNSGDLSFQFEKNAKLKIENYGAGIYQSSTAKDVSLNISGYGILEITGSHNSNPGSAAGMFLHSIGKKALKINGNSDEERMTVRCNGNQAAGIDWYPSSLDKDDPLEFVCKYTNLYTSNNSYNGINFQTDNGVERNHNSVYAKVTDSYFEASGNTGGSGVMNNWGNNTYDDHNTSWEITNSKVILNNNKLDGFTSAKLTLNNVDITANGNNRGGISGVSLDSYGSNITVNDNNQAFAEGSIGFYGGLRVHTIIGQTEDDFYSHIVKTKINANGNGSYGVRFSSSVDQYKVVPYIKDSAIVAEENGYAGVYFGHGGVVTDNSAIETKANFVTGVANADGELKIDNSFISCTEESRQGIYHIDKDKVVIDNQTVGRISAAMREIYIKSDAALNQKETYVLNGSLQADLNNMSGSYGDAWNTVKAEDEIYAAPMNQFKTKLVRFDLHKNINKECTADTNAFKTYDPNANEAYEYSFRYNREGEDLDTQAFGNAYVWTPASILNYDATEGSIAETGTAGKFAYGSSVTTDRGAAKGQRFTSDIAIFGNSLDLAEKAMPTAEKAGYVFLGWYYADDEEKAKELAMAGKFDDLYELLNTEFTSASKVAKGMSDDPADGVAEKTIYAKWMSENAYYYTGNLTVRKFVTEKGRPYIVNNTFYAGLFDDAACTKPSTDSEGNPIIIELPLAGTDHVEVTADDIPLGIHYVAETNKEGKVWKSDKDHTITIDHPKVDIKSDLESDEIVTVTITNEYDDYEGYYEDDGSNGSSSEQEDGDHAAKTGDDSSMVSYIALLVLAAAVGTAAVAGRKRRSTKR